MEKIVNQVKIEYIPDKSGKPVSILGNDRKTEGLSSRTQGSNGKFYNVHQKLKCTL